MNTNEQAKSAGSDRGRTEDLKDGRKEQIDFQILQALSRIESQIASIEGRLSSGGGRGPVRRVSEKPNPRNLLLGLMMKGWLSETEALEKTGWTTIGVRSLITKLRTNGVSIDTEERDGVPFYRIAKSA